MKFLPFYGEILVLPVDAEGFLKILKKNVLEEIDFQDPERLAEDKVFAGTINKARFRIYKRTHQPNNFMPLIKGEVEGTSVGCIVFIKYKLFNSTNFFLLFWTIVAIGIGSFFILSQRNISYGILSFSFGLLNYLVTIINFNRFLKNSKNSFLEVFISNLNESL